MSGATAEEYVLAIASMTDEDFRQALIAAPGARHMIALCQARMTGIFAADRTYTDGENNDQ